MQRRSVLIGLSGVVLAGCSAIQGPGLGDAAGSKPAADANAPPSGALLAACDQEIMRFFGSPEWAGFRNLVGGASGIFIAPSSTTAGFLVGAQFGRGVVLARHGSDWSDPVFVQLTNVSVGFLAGAAKSAVLMLILTNGAIDQFVSGANKISTSGGFALGNWGVGAFGAGGFSGGAQVLTAQTSSGLFAGGGLGSAQMSLDRILNQEAYGPSFEAGGVLGRSGGMLRDAAVLRTHLSAAVREAWSN